MGSVPAAGKEHNKLAMDSKAAAPTSSTPPPSSLAEDVLLHAKMQTLQNADSCFMSKHTPSNMMDANAGPSSSQQEHLITASSWPGRGSLPAFSSSSPDIYTPVLSSTHLDAERKYVSEGNMYSAFSLHDAEVSTPLQHIILTPGAADNKQLRHAFYCSYVNTLIPTLRRIHSQSLRLSLDEKVSAVKAAADMSLAVSAASAGQNAWSRALLEEVASSSSIACKSLLLKRCKKPSRGRANSKNSTMLGKKSKRGRFSVHASSAHLTNVADDVQGSACILMHSAAASCYTAEYPSPASSAVMSAHSISRKGGFYPTQSCTRRSLIQTRPVMRRSGLSSYLKILRSSRCKRKTLHMGRKHARNSISAPASVISTSSPSPVISEQQIESLGGLVPGGRNMDVPLLLQEAADYIVSLQIQVQALQSLARLVSSSQLS